MKFWNSEEIITHVLEGLEIGDKLDNDTIQELADIVIDFVVDLVQMHNFQIERESDSTNADVGILLGNYSANLADWFITSTASMLASFGISDDARNMVESWYEND